MGNKKEVKDPCCKCIFLRDRRCLVTTFAVSEKWQAKCKTLGWKKIKR